jgi:outer membrane protein assembly factor BamE
MKRYIITLTCLLCLLLSGCWIHPYQPDIQQGNIITDQMVASLRPGMSKDQVRSILGQPILENVFSDDYWAYVYTFQHSGGPIIKKQLNLFFQYNRLVHITGNWGSPF